MCGSRGEVGEHTLKLCFSGLPLSCGKQILGSLTLQMEYQIGVVDVKDACYGTLFIFSVECYVMIGISLELKLIHLTRDVHCWLLVRRPHTTETQLG